MSEESGTHNSLASEIPRPYPITRIGNGARFVVEAKPDECRKLAARMGICAIQSLSCRFDLRRGPNDRVDATGLLRARVRQTCVVSLDPFDADLVEAFSLRFVPEGQESEQVDIESDDEIPYLGGILDLGEAAAEQLALALDPFPRKPGAEMIVNLDLSETGPFAGLAKLRPHG
jgi:uncharacterized metal-binding protein YceD (DUF177 family)